MIALRQGQINVMGLGVEWRERSDQFVSFVSFDA
jgi:hypothetical protein